MSSYIAILSLGRFPLSLDTLMFISNILHSPFELEALDYLVALSWKTMSYS